jgi:hypothetical protein
MAQTKARNDEREQEDRAHAGPRPTTYEITPKNASLPGLPLPVVATESKGKTKSAKFSSPGDELGRMATGRSPDSEVILNEATKILADYVDLLGGQHERSQLAGPRKSEGVLCSDRCPMGLY